MKRSDFKNLVISEDIKMRFWEKVRKTSTCWLWIGAKGSYKYGV